MAKTLQQTVTNYTNSAPTAETNYKAGVLGSTAPIVQAAIAAQGAMVSNFNQAVTSGRWAARLNAVGDAAIRQAAANKSANYANGITQGAPKFQAAMSQWLPIIDSAAATVRAMPSGTLAASIARSAAFQTALYNAKRGL